MQFGDKQLDLSTPQIMAVINVTPDSFSDGGQLFAEGRLNAQKVLQRAEQSVAQGASILDIGGESTRPGAAVVGLQEEMDRVLPAVEQLHNELDVVISVDTSSPELMIEAAKLGAGMINDVRALQKEGALSAAASTGLPVCLMHMQGQPDTMQKNPQYQSVVEEVSEFLQERINAAQLAGIAKEKLIIDPGFGFGKSVDHNLLLLQRLGDLAKLGYPVLAGLSRKSLIGAVLGRQVEDRLAGSLALAMIAIEQGAAIIRVHDVQPTTDILKMYQAVYNR